MSNDQHVNEAFQALSSIETTTTRPRQESKLALLPVEILFKITGEPGKDEETLLTSEFKALAVSCSRLFHFARPMYYLADNGTAFRLALERGDIDTIKRCAQFEAAPDTKWKFSQYCKCQAERTHRCHSPVDVLLESVAIDCVPIDKCVEILRWLLENGYEASEQADQDWWMRNDYGDHMPELVVTLLNDSPDQASTEGIFEMIQLLKSHGRSLPFHMSIGKCRSRFRPYVTKPRALIHSPMDVAFRSHSPTEFVEVLLQEYRNRQIDVKVWHSHPSPELERWAGKYQRRCWGFQDTNVGNLIWGLFQDLVDPMTPWKETYHGEAADIFERKLRLLVEYQFIESHEEILLQSVLQALRDIAESVKTQGGTAQDGDREVWTRLYDSIRPHATNEDIQARHIKNNEEWGVQDPKRTHRFIIESTWDPYDFWFRYELQKPSVRSQYSRVWTSRSYFRIYESGMTGKFVDLEWNRIVETRERLEDFPAWYDITYGEFVAAVERFWEKYNLNREDPDPDSWSGWVRAIERQEYLDEAHW
ncbi:hypothetical protein FAVG1_10328 [Fusarium avenaceum]|nr:hypothetical protein FAVG1_10328 [Fusarium avenaceum]